MLSFKSRVKYWGEGRLEYRYRNKLWVDAGLNGTHEYDFEKGDLLYNSHEKKLYRFTTGTRDSFKACAGFLWLREISVPKELKHPEYNCAQVVLENGRLYWQGITLN